MTDHEAARREKLRKITELGHDPWGGRFDGRSLIGELRARRGEIHFVKEGGQQVEIPDRDAQPDLDFRGWLQDQGKGEMTGPKVRAAGRIVLSRDRELILARYSPGASVTLLAERNQRTVNSVSQSLRRIRNTLAECIGRTLRAEGLGR